MKKQLTVLFSLLTILVFGQIPAGYYDSAAGLSGAALKAELNNIIDGQTELSYSAAYDQLKYTDEDPNNSNNVLLLYTGWSYPKSNTGGAADNWNREHTWAKSHGNFGTSPPAGTDLHHLRPTDDSVNSARGNLYFDNGGSPYSDSSRYGQSGTFATGCKKDGDSWEPRDEVKGDVARMIFYMATRYEGENGEVDLEVYDGIPANNADPLHGVLSTLLAWHNSDPVSAWEVRRNNRVYERQGNRNPYIDHPEYVQAIWGGTIDNTPPTDPANLVTSNATSNSIMLAWTPSTDDVGVDHYDVYVDNVNTYTATNTPFVATGLSANTNYCFTVVAVDAAGNSSNDSNQACETTLDSGSTGSNCASETFENTPASGSYNDFSWNGDNGASWSATNARTDQTINSKAIVLRNGVLTSPSIVGGIGSLTVKTKRFFSGGTGSYDVAVNGTTIGTVAYDATEQTITIPNINTTGNIVVELSKTASSSSSDRVGFDDLSWTCYTTAAIDEENLNTLKIYPNPIKNGQFYIDYSKPVQLIIYTILGKNVYTKQHIANDVIDISSLKTGIYLVKIIGSKGTTYKKIKIE